MKDTYNLLADGIVQLLRALAAVAGAEAAAAQGYDRYLGASLKGEADIDWADGTERQAFLGAVVSDADRLLDSARQAQARFDPESSERRQLVDAAQLLAQLLLQDVERTEEGPALRDGVSRDRIVSVHDPEMRHGHKSSSKRFDGHKASVTVDTDSQLITAVAVLPGNAPDNMDALELVKQSEENTEAEVEETIGDAAYGDGNTRQAFADAGRQGAGPPQHCPLPQAGLRDRPGGRHVPVPGGETSPAPCAQTERGETATVADTRSRSSSSTHRSAAYACCGHGVSRREHAEAGR